METLATTIAEHAATRPDDVAFYADDDTALSWQSYADRSDHLAAALATLGLERGDRVAVVLPDGPGVHVAFVGVEKAGLISMGIGPRAGRAELIHLLKRSGARALISRATYRDIDMARLVAEAAGSGLALAHHVCVDGEFEAPDSLRIDGAPCTPSDRPLEAVPRAVDEPFLLNSTSGTTGMPKCVTHDQLRWLHFHELAREAGAFTSDDIFMSVIPAPFGFGLWTAHFSPTLLGVPCVVTANFSADAMVRAIERHRISVLAAVSTQFVMMLNSPELERSDLSSLRVLFTGGEAVPYQRASEFEERTGASVLQFYGSNETGALSRTALGDPRDKRLRTAGRLIDSMQVRLIDDDGNDTTAAGNGQPACKGPLLSRGYWNDDAANAELYTSDGWMRTGDVATLDAEGFLSIVGRAGDFIIRGGKNISAPAVEQAVATHPSVQLCAVVAMPDPVFGEKVCAYVELGANASLSLDELLEHLRSQDVSKENLPERLVVVDEIPRSSGGKVAKAALREDIRARLRDEGVAER